MELFKQIITWGISITVTFLICVGLIRILKIYMDLYIPRYITI